MEKAKQRCKRHLTKKGALYKKMQGFCYNYGKKPRNRPNSSLLDINKVLKRIGENPRCYLTGKSIDISDMSSYSLDHIKPLSRGGKSTIKNLGLATSQANQCKSDLTLEELVVLCKEILVQQGFDIIKK
jgi:CRISPR/Cas system Type II protein with McrA/HNH and RuvC-like nuclease domain